MCEYIGWHFLASPDELGYGDKRKPQKGVTMGEPDLSESEGKLSLCRGGFHACERVLDALDYAPGPYVAKVRLSGELIKENKKACALERTPLTEYIDVSKVLHEFACWCAERALTEANVKDERCWQGIEAKRQWLRGEIADKQLAAARAAARTTARTTAMDAARNAARAAAGTAAARNEQNAKLTDMLEEVLHETD